MIASVQHLVQHLQPMTAPRRVSLPVLILLLLSMFGGMLHAASVELEVVSVSATTVDLSWSATDLTGLQVYEVTWIVPGISKIKPVQQLTSTTITGLTASTRYSFRVAAKCGATTVYSQYAYATTSGPGSSNTPSAPANLQATEVSFNVVELGWVDTSANASGFKIYRSSNPSSGFVQVGTTNKGITSYRNAGLSASTTYYFKVCANNADGDSDFTDVLAVTTSATPPAAPTKLTASAVSTDQINLSWSDASQNEDGFTIERSTSNNGPFDKVATVEANAASYADSNLNDATSYFYRVYAFNAEGSSGYSNVANATTKARPPETPTGLQATATSTNQIALSWTGVSGAMGYKLQYAVGANGSFLPALTLAPSLTSYTYNSLKTATTYYFRICAYNFNGESEYSEPVCATTLATLPAAPTNLVATTISSAQIDLRWAGINGSSEYIIERSTAANGDFKAVGTTEGGATSFSDVKLDALTTYLYRVFASNSAGQSGYSNTAKATTLAKVLDSPSDLQATATSTNQISLSWTGVSGAMGYKLHYAVGANGSFLPALTLPPSVTSYTYNSLKTDTTYYFRIYAYNSYGNSEFSEVVSATTLSALPPLPSSPAGLVATAVSADQINLSWNAVKDATGYTIERAASANGAFEEIGSANAGETTFSNTGLTASTTYYYKVRASNEAGNSAYSNVASAKTEAPKRVLPGVPANLSATAVSTDRINLGWNAAKDATGYTIERAESANGAFKKIGSANAGESTFSNTGLAASTTYYYKVYASNKDGDSAYSNMASAKTEAPKPVLPEVPANLSATAVSTDQINLSWNAAKDATGYTIERAASANGAFVKIGSANAGVTTFSNTGLAASTTYFYRVYASNKDGDSAYSNVASAKTEAPKPVLPGVPANLSATAVSTDQINLSWNAAKDATGYTIERTASANGAFVKIGSANAGVTTFSNTGLAASTTYFYRVYASNKDGDSAYSNVASAKTEAPKPVLPGVPANLSATAVSTDQINLSWNAAKDATGYTIERAESANGEFKKIGSANVRETTFSNTGLAASTAYFYRVRAFNEAGSSDYSNVASATTQKSPPAAPAKLIASAVSTDQINLSWNAAKDATGYTIERAESANGEFKKIGSANVKETKFSNMGLAASTTYFYRVCAFNEAGSSEFSNVANATTQSSSQSSPSGLTATAVSTTQIDLSWAPAANVIGYTIERSTSENGTFSKTAFVAANVTTYSNMGLAPSTTYYYRVYANGIAGNSDYSNVASATTQAPSPPKPKLPAPSDLTSTAVHANRVELTWVSNSTNEFGFYLQRSETPGFGNLTTFTIGAGRTSYSDAGLAEGTDYFYRVCAYGITGNSDCSDVLAVTTRLKPPTNLRAAADSPTSVTLTWADNSDKEKSYWVERLGSDGEWITVGAELPANTQTYQDVSCEPARTYVYRVTALGASAETSSAATALGASAETSSEATASTPTVYPIDLRWLGPVATDHLATVNSSYAVAATDDYLYSVSAGVLSIYSFVTYDAAPEFHSYIRINGAYGVTAAVINGEEFAFVTEGKALRVIKPTDPSFSRVVNLPATAFKPVCDGNVVYVACGSAGVAVVDVSDPYNPYLLNTPNMGITQAWSVDARGSALVVANGSNGLVVLDASDPADLVKVATVDLMGCFGDMADNAFDVAIGNNMVWVACVYSGLCQVDISSLHKPEWVRSIPTTAPATGVCTEGDYVFVACNDGISARTGLDAFGCGGGVVEHLGFLRTPGYATRQIATRNRMIFLSDNWYLADVAAF